MNSIEPITITLPDKISLDHVDIEHIADQFVWASIIVPITIALIICGTIALTSYFKHKAQMNCKCDKSEKSGETSAKKGGK